RAGPPYRSAPRNVRLHPLKEFPEGSWRNLEFARTSSNGENRGLKTTNDRTAQTIANEIMRLRFPPLAGGVIQGLNDAGIETFEGDYPHFVVRECAQNSLDAAASHKKPVRMEITVHTLPVSELPFFPDLRNTLLACKSFWHGQP